MSKFPFYKQHDAMDCSPTCLRTIAKHHGVNHSIQALRQLSEIGKDEESFFDDLSESGEEAISMERLIEDVLGSSSLVEQGLLKAVNHQALLRAK
jgi:ABC-type bacteriocin/lantibiotic exporter with double-glycine peptidase domain